MTLKIFSSTYEIAIQSSGNTCPFRCVQGIDFGSLENPNEQGFLSQLIRLDKRGFLYGRIESRLRMHNLQGGTWPAFWMLEGRINEQPIKKEPMFVLINLAIGGLLGGAVDPSLNLATLEIDYVAHCIATTSNASTRCNESTPTATVSAPVITSTAVTSAAIDTDYTTLSSTR